MFSENLNKTIKLRERGLKLIFTFSSLTIFVFCALSFLLPKKAAEEEVILPALVVVGFLIAIINFFLFKIAGSYRCLKTVYDKTKFKDNPSDEEKNEKRLLNVINNYSQGLSVNTALNSVTGVFGLVLALYSEGPVPASYALWAYGIILNCYMWPRIGRVLEKFVKKLEASSSSC